MIYLISIILLIFSGFYRFFVEQRSPEWAAILLGAMASIVSIFVAHIVNEISEKRVLGRCVLKPRCGLTRATGCGYLPLVI